jgi:hypothetical protein
MVLFLSLISFVRRERSLSLKEFILTPELAQELDKYSPSVSERAGKVWGVLSPEMKDKVIIYDLSCFCVEFLSLQAQNEMPFMLDSVKKVASMFYYAHYFHLWMLHKDENEKMEGGDNGEQGPLLRSEGTTIIKDTGE